MKKILFGFIFIFCIMGLWGSSMEVHATNTYVRLFVDCDGGTCHTTNAFDIIHGEDRAQVGSTVSSVYNFDEDPTAVDKDFVGWYVYDNSTNQQIAGTGLLTTTQVNNYVIPGHDIKFVAQWTPRQGYPVKNITYAAFYNGEGEPCYGIKISIVKDGICYSGYGFVSIPESVYSTWTGNIEISWESLEGYYLMYNGKWRAETNTYTSTVKSFLKEKSCYCSANTSTKGQEVLSPRRKVHDWFYQASFVSPDISVLHTSTAADVINNTAVVPASYTVETEVYQSGSIYDSAVNAAMSSYGTSNVVVVDIELKDDNGVNVTQLSDYVDVRVDIPVGYNVQQGNTIIVYYLNDNGVLEACDTTYFSDDPNNRYVTFKTNHFSVYVLVETEVVTEPELESEVELDSEPEMEAEVEPESASEAESKQESESEAEAEVEDIETETITDSQSEEVYGEVSKDESNGVTKITVVIALVAAVLMLVFVVLKKKSRR